MIPSINKSYPTGFNEYDCDCCARHITPFIDGMGFMKLVAIPQAIGGVTYFACTLECSRILFTIHHQYAMREGK